MLEIELSKDIEARLAKIADATGRSLAACAAEAIERYVESPSPQRITYGERIIVHMLADWVDTLAGEKGLEALRQTLPPALVLAALESGRDHVITEHIGIGGEEFQHPGTAYQAMWIMLDDLADARERGCDVPLFSGISDDEEADALADLAQVAHAAYKGKNQARHVDYSLPERPLAFWRELAERYSDRRAGEGV